MASPKPPTVDSLRHLPTHFVQTLMSDPLEFCLRRVGNNLTLGHKPTPASRPTPSKRVLVIGGGVTGLTTAWALLDAGFGVVVLSDQWAPASPRIVSQVAGALWEWPPAVCGAHTNSASLVKSKRWCMTSYHIFSKLAAVADPANHGIRMRLANFFFKKKLEDLPEQLAKMREIEAAGIRGFTHDPNLVDQHAVNQDVGIIDSYRYLAPVVDTDVYMTWLRALIVKKGAILRTGCISGDLIDIEWKLLAAYGANAIVNATGLQAKELAADPTVFPLRGALIRVVNDGKKFPRVTQALCVTHDESRPDEDTIVFIVPRNDNTLILGGIAQPGIWDLDLTLSSPEIQRIRTRCNNFVPGLENAELDEDAPLVQGLRPLTKANVRVAREPRARKYGRGASRIVHSYGHGGSGFTLSFGCALDVLAIVQEIVKEEQPMDAVVARL